MNSTPPSIPSLKSLYYRDFTIQRAVQTIGFSLFAAAGIQWATQPVPSVVKVVQSPFEIFAAQWGPLIGVVVAALAVMVLVRRYFWVKSVLCRGAIIKGIVEDVDIYSREASHSDNAPAFQRSYIRSYYVIIRFAAHGVDMKKRFKLPHSPSTYKIIKGHEIDLLVLDSAPGKPLIREVYLGRF
ncbi:MAG: hypothetical protein NTV80_06430 [Verrucomicrobia bacterium]|nr:hypothetical protein [Verrucomicrobiota bacterium]